MALKALKGYVLILGSCMVSRGCCFVFCGGFAAVVFSFVYPHCSNGSSHWYSNGLSHWASISFHSFCHWFQFCELSVVIIFVYCFFRLRFIFLFLSLLVGRGFAVIVFAPMLQFCGVPGRGGGIVCLLRFCFVLEKQQSVRRRSAVSRWQDCVCSRFSSQLLVSELARLVSLCWVFR